MHLFIHIQIFLLLLYQAKACLSSRAYRFEGAGDIKALVSDDSPNTRYGNWI